MGQEASVPQRIGDDLSRSSQNKTTNNPNHNDGSAKAANAIRGATNDAAAVAVAVAAANNAAASVFVGQSSPPLSSQPQSQQQQQQQQQQQYAANTNNNNSGTATTMMMMMPSNSNSSNNSGPSSSSASSSLMSRSGITSMIQSAKRLSVRTNASATAGGGGGGEDSSSITTTNNSNNSTHIITTTTMMNNGIGTATMQQHQHQHPQNSPLPLHQQNYYPEVHHGELSPKSQAIIMQQQQQQQRQMMMGVGLNTNKLKKKTKNQQQPHQHQQSTPFSSAQSTPYHTPQGTPQGSSSNHVVYTFGGGGGGGGASGSGHHNNMNSTASDDAQTVHTTNVTTTTTNLVHGMKKGLSLNSNSYHGTKITTTTTTKLNKGLSPPASPRALAISKMKDNDEDDWAKAWAEDSGDDSDDDEEEEEVGLGEVGSDMIVGGGVGAGIGISGQHQPPSMPMLLPVQGTAMGQHHQHHHHQQQQQQLHQPQQQFIQQQFMQQQQSGPFPYATPGQSQSKLPTDRIMQQEPNALFTSPPPQQQQQQQQHYQPQPQQQQQQQAIIEEEEEEDAKLVLEADQALLKDGGSWDPYCADDNEVEKPSVEMFDPALRVLGRGSFGRVVLVQKQYGQGQGGLFAMKILRKSHLVRRRQIERTKTERKVLARLDHPFLMKLYYAFQNTEKLFLVLDYCPGGELFFHLSRYRRFQEPVARFYAAELMLAIGHLHKHGVIYRDLKPENVLLDAYGHVKLGDFGLAKDGIRHPTQGAKSTCGTPEYMAPEVLNQQGHGFCVDYWGLGMILFEMMTGLPPWYTTDRAKLFRRLRSAPLIFPNEISFSPHCKTCIAGLLERDPRLRIGVLGLRSAMRHEFFHRKINFEALRARQISAPIRPCEGWRQFQSRSSSVENESKGWHSANPSLDSAAMGNITAEALDVATANFDDSFRRMPIETEDFETQQQAQGHPPISEKDLNAQTFRGFTFDGDIPGDVPSPEESQNPPNDLRGEMT